MPKTISIMLIGLGTWATVMVIAGVREAVADARRPKSGKAGRRK